MSNIDKRALREAAEKATPGKWRYLKTTPFMDAEISAENHTRVVNLLAGDVTVDNSEFIATADPATVLALLDELEAKETENERMALELLNRSGEIEGLRQRIAELESREINLPPYSFFDFKQGSPFKSGAYCHIDSVNKELSKHCIKMIAAAGKGE